MCFINENYLLLQAYFQSIKILQSPNQIELNVVEFSVNIRINYRVYTQAFIGGIPAAIAER